jgi:hypothetical protein
MIMRPVSRAFVILLALSALSASSAHAALPDWSGEWEVIGFKANVSGVVATPVSEIIRNFGSPPPYNLAEEAKFRAHLKEFGEQHERRGDTNTCTFGFPIGMFFFPVQYFEILNTPRETAIIYSGREIRQIYTDGRGQPPSDELFPTHWGSSVGHWEGQTLVIDTVSAGGNIAAEILKPDENFIFIGNAADFFQPLAILDGQAHYVERLRMVNPGVLEDQMTITDPTQFTGPWKLTRRYQRVKGVTRMVHEDCEGNDRNPIVNGKWTLK